MEAPVIAGTRNRTVLGPTSPSMRRSVKTARPSGPVATVFVPFNVPPPAVISATTLTSGVGTGLPPASCSCTIGCWGQTTPACTLLEGLASNPNLVASPTPRVTGSDVTGSREPELNVTGKLY